MAMMKEAASISALSSGERPGNNLLRLLRSSDYALIAPHLKPAELQANEVLYNPGDNIETVYFPCGPSLISLAVVQEDGRDVETIMIGREGAVGGIVSSGRLPAYCRITARYGGPFVRLRVSYLEAAKGRSLTLRSIFARYADCVLTQAFQSSACNAVHSIEQRTAKWLLAAMERTGEREVVLNHEQLAALLGVGRSYASRVIQAFRADEILETRRGSIVVRDEEALKARSCTCNASVKHHFETVLRGAYPDET
jgi:CRP-like cAMP-binding protein